MERAPAQGIGAALIAANSGAIISELYPPEERGRAYGFNAFGWSFGSVLGVLLGGVIVTYVSWRWIFWINLPIGAIALELAVRVLRDRGERIHRRLDTLGMVTLGLGLFGVLWAMTALAARPLNAAQIGYLVGGVVLLVAFVFVELRQSEPTLDLSPFRIPAVAPSLLASLFQGLGSFAVLFLVIMYLQVPVGPGPRPAASGWLRSATRGLCRRRSLAGFPAGLLPDRRDDRDQRWPVVRMRRSAIPVSGLPPWGTHATRRLTHSSPPHSGLCPAPSPGPGVVDHVVDDADPAEGDGQQVVELDAGRVEDLQAAGGVDEGSSFDTMCALLLWW